MRNLTRNAYGAGLALGFLFTAGTVSTTWAGGLSGAVHDTNGAAIAWAFIDLFDEDGLYFDYTYSDQQGHFFFENLGSGTFYARTDTLGDYVEEWYDNVPGASDAVFFDPLAAGATPIVVGWNEQVTGVNFSLETGASISGVVRDDNGHPVTNIYVDAHLPGGMRFLSALTDTGGAYRLRGLPAGDFAVRTDSRGDYIDLWHDGRTAFDLVSPDEVGVAPYIHLAPGQTASGVAFDLEPGASAAGHVFAWGGEPVAGVYVDLYDHTGKRIEFSRSDTNGAFRMGGLPGDTYYLGTDSLGSYVDLWYDQRLVLHPTNPIADGADAVLLAPLEVRSNLVFTLDQGASIAGQVLGPLGAPVADAIVDAYRDSVFFDFAVTDGNGWFDIRALPDGTYYVKVDTLGAFLDTWYQDHVVYEVRDPVADGADPVTLAGGVSVTGLLFELDVGAEILGSVTEDGGGPLADCYLDLYAESGRRLFYTQSASNGTFRLGGLPEGTYYLCTDTLGQFVDEWYQDRVLFTRSNPLGNAAQALTLAHQESLANVNVALIRGGSVSGTITGPEGVPLATAYVDVFLSSNYYAFARADSNGFYRVDTLPQEALFLQTDNPQGLVNEWYQDVYIFHQGLPEADNAHPVLLARDEDRTGIDFVLGPGASLQGSVRATGGGPLPEVFIDVFDYAGRYYDLTMTAEDGTFGMQLLPPGTWYVGTETFGDYMDEWYQDVPRLAIDDPMEDGATALVLSDGEAVADLAFELALPRIPARLSISMDGFGEALISWFGEDGLAYQVERRGHLPDDTWDDAPSGTSEIEQSFKPSQPEGERFYRDPLPAASSHHYRVRTF